MKKNTKILLGLAAVAGAYWLWKKKNSAPTSDLSSKEPIKSPAPPKKDEEPMLFYYPTEDKLGMPRVAPTPFNYPTATVDEYGLVIRE